MPSPSPLHSVGRALQDVWDGLLNVVYPPRCLGCSARVADPALPLCPACLGRMDRAPTMAVAARIDRLAVPRGALRGAMALWVFDKESPLQAVQHALKYGNRPRYGVSLGQLVGQAYAELWPVPDAVVPIPLHRTRLLERGYNQSAMLAEGVADALGCPVRAGLLARPHPTRSQTNLSRPARWQNVCAAFEATDDAAGGTWLLVDDVLTTGSTAVAAAQTLREAGAADVYLATLAMART